MKPLYPTLCTAALLMLAACTNDLAEDLQHEVPGTDNLPQGTFIVDYLPSTDLPATRGVADGERILSLDYLLYERLATEDEYTLKKQVSISDINADTPWPLKRENMTWKQRQELKDTLLTSSTYKVVFVANAANGIWRDESITDEENQFHPLSNVTENANTFDEARLLLPPNGDFQHTDGKESYYTFYYMWQGDINPKDATTGFTHDKDNPMTMDVVLKRMVNKVEIRLEDITEGFTNEDGNVAKTEEELLQYVEGQINQFYDANYPSTESDNTSEWGILAQAVYTDLNDRVKNISDAGIAANAQAKSKEKFKDIIQNLGNMRKAVANISGTNTLNAKDWFLKQTKQNYYTRCDWSKINTIDIIYEQANFSQAIGFDKKYESENESGTLTAIKVADNNYIFYAFGSDESNANLAKIQKMQFKDDANNMLFESECGIIPGGNSSTGGNRHLIMNYQPIKSVSVGKETGDFTIENYDLYNVLYDSDESNKYRWDWDDFEYKDNALIESNNWTKDDMIKWVNSLFSQEDNSQEFVPYDFILQLKLMTITDEWQTSDATQSATTE